jgi:uncharacterized protein (TIGR02118 family)
MAQMIVIYKTPKDPAAFDKHYFDVQVPLIKQLPGLRRCETSRPPVISLFGATDAYFVATLHFDSLAEVNQALISVCGRACGADQRLAPDANDVQVFLFDTNSI